MRARYENIADEPNCAATKISRQRTDTSGQEPDKLVLHFGSAGISPSYLKSLSDENAAWSVTPDSLPRLLRFSDRRYSRSQPAFRYSAVSYYFAVNWDEVPRQSSSVEVPHRRSSACDTQLRSQISVDYNSLNVFS
jgi:hypothetical protein